MDEALGEVGRWGKGGRGQFERLRTNEEQKKETGNTKQNKTKKGQTQKKKKMISKLEKVAKKELFLKRARGTA